MKRVGKTSERNICKQMLELCTNVLIKHVRIIDVVIMVVFENRRI